MSRVLPLSSHLWSKLSRLFHLTRASHRSRASSRLTSTVVNAGRRGTVRVRFLPALVPALVALPLPVLGGHPHADDPSALHMVMTPSQRGTAADTARAAAVAATLRQAIAKYADTTAAVADGYRMFAPQVKQQKVYHFTSRWAGMQEAFRFDPAKPTSLLYKRAPDGRLRLVGAMYVAPRRSTPEQLDARVPLGVARWHRHVNWCIPNRGDGARWLERKDGHAVFGPDSPVATKAQCDAVHGVFHESLFGWMVHANVFEGDDPRVVWGDEHAGVDMHAGMKMDQDM